jgi:hypothetical protein
MSAIEFTTPNLIQIKNPNTNRRWLSAAALIRHKAFMSHSCR